MIEPDSLRQLRMAIAAQLLSDRHLLDELRTEVRPLRDATRRIQARAATTISLVAADGGNNRIQFDPFMVQLVRVVDSSNNEYCLEAVTPTTDMAALAKLQFADGQPITALGELMAFLKVSTLPALSHMIHPPRQGRPASTNWVLTYRSLVEWAILFKIIRTKDFATDTLVVFDGLLRSKMFASDYFVQMMGGIQDAIERHWQQHRRRIYLVGVAKHSAALERYQLAMALEHVLTCEYPAYVEVPRDVESKAYVWDEWARGSDVAQEGEEALRFVIGKLYFVKFGQGSRDPIWPIDVMVSQQAEAPMIFGYLLADAVDGFPVPYYPRCLQKAHENAALVDFDFDVLQDEVFRGLRGVLGQEAPALDAFMIRDADPSQRRYG